MTIIQQCIKFVPEYQVVETMFEIVWLLIIKINIRTNNCESFRGYLATTVKMVDLDCFHRFLPIDQIRVHGKLRGGLIRRWLNCFARKIRN
jgi:hypothetical protein